MTKLLEEITMIRQGIPISRIKVIDNEEIEERLIYSFEKEESKVKLPKKINALDQKVPLVKKDMILFNIVSYNAKRARIEDLGKVVPSNYVIIIPRTDKVDIDYLAWYLGESIGFKRELYRLKQGSTVMSLPINELRNIKINLPCLAVQEKIGKLNKLRIRKKMLEEEKDRLIKKFLINKNEEVINND